MDWLNLSAGGGVLKPGASEPVTPATLPPRWRRPDQLSGTGRHHCANGPFSRPRLKSLPMRHPERPGALATTRVVMAVHRFLAVLAKGNGRWKDLADSSEGTLCPAALGAATGDDLIRAREASLRVTRARVSHRQSRSRIDTFASSAETRLSVGRLPDKRDHQMGQLPPSISAKSSGPSRSRQT